MTWLYQPLLPGGGDLSSATGTVGYVKIWNGTAWEIKPAKVWDGNEWVIKPARVWDGAEWVLTNPSP